MAKSTKRQVRKATSRSVTPSPTSRVTQREFNPDYSYVVKDLKRIGSLAGFFFVVLVALSFIIK